jgi:hypothetical protein
MVRKKAPTKKKSPQTRKSAIKRAQKTRPLHKRIMLHPFFVFIFMCIGVLLVAWTLKAAAVNIKVTARVAGVAPSIPAVINSPVENDRFSTLPVSISGSCPADSYVNIFSNGVELGTALCSVSNDFSLSISLFPDQNELIAHVYNLADVEGPQSNPVNVFYDVPPPPVNPPPSSGGGSASQTPASTTKDYPKTTNKPFLVQTEFNTQGFYVGEKVNWPISITGGQKPFALNVDWGDGSSSVYSRAEDGDFEISHVYLQPGPNQGSYSIKINASDSNNTNAHLDFFVFVSANDNPLVANSANHSGTGASLGGISKSFFEQYKWLLVAWPSYATVLLMGASFWLGERQEFLKLHRHRRR